MNSSKYRLLATDMDGTLLNSKSLISDVTKKRLLELQEQGMVLVLASGRAPFELESFAKELELKKYGGCLIHSNGAGVLFESDGHEVLFPKIELNDLRYMIKESSKRGLLTIVNVRGQYLCNYSFKNAIKRKFARALYDQLRALKIISLRSFAYMAKKAKMVEHLEEFVFEDSNKIAIRGHFQDLQKIQVHLMETFPNKYNYFYLSEGSLEVTRIEVSKAKALRFLCEELGIDKQDVVVFGDSNNDDEMLECFPTSVAMGNAFEKTKQVAKYITKTNDEDGIVHFLDSGIQP